MMKPLFKLRDYQIEIANKAFKQLLNRGWCYLSMQVRTGKTLTSLHVSGMLGGSTKRVVFVTKKKAINSIKDDVSLLNNPSIKVDIVNYESLHKLDLDVFVDVWILDEAHKLGQIGKASNKTKLLKSIIHKYSKVIFLSGTPTPETGAQIYHQMYVLGDKSPFKEPNFYKWAKVNCNITERMINGYSVKDYKNCHFDINKLDFISYSQKDAGFKNKLIEHFLTVEMSKVTKKIIKTLKKDKIFRGKDDVILADTSVKEMQKIHQLSSGTCILENSGKSIIIDDAKALFIKSYFKDKKIAIFYKFKGELELLKKHFNITQDIEEFNTTDKIIALQFISGREGIKLNKADCIVAINIDFSATTYWQFRDRMTTIDSKEGDIYFIVSDCGIEMDVYKAVSKKKKFTSKFYERINLSKKNNKETRSKRMVRSKTDENQQNRNTRHSSDDAQQSMFH